MIASFANLLEVALGIQKNLEPSVLFPGLLDGLQEIIPYDVATILLLKGDWLEVAAQRGFRPGLSDLHLRFEIERQPRLKRALQMKRPLRFEDPMEPDPFDDLVMGAEVLTGKLHSCMAAPLIVEDEPIGLITVDALKENLFQKDQEELLWFFGAFASLSIRHSRLIESLKRSHQNLEIENLRLKEREKDGALSLVGDSSLMQNLRKNVSVLANTDSNILISGPTGCGKELVARSLHRQSTRSQKPLLYVNCAAIVETLAESELFGHVRGAFTSAIQNRAGKFEQANQGTLFLDEIGELPLSIQAKLLRVLEEGEIQKVGSDHSQKVDVRVIAATNRNLLQMIAEGSFRRDLYHRLAVLRIEVPGLNERKEDIGELAAFFIRVYGQKTGIRLSLTPDLIRNLKDREWEGGVRELFHHLESMAAWARALGQSELRAAAPNPVSREISHGKPEETQLDMKEATWRFQLSLAEKALNIHEGNWSKAARSLGLDPANFYRKFNQKTNNH